MKHINPFANRSRIRWALFAGSVGLVVVGHVIINERSLDDIGPHAILDALFTLILLCGVLLMAAGWGRVVMRRLQLKNLSPLEQLLFGLPIGLGIMAYGVLALGLLGLLTTAALVLWLVLPAVFLRREWRLMRSELPGWQRYAQSVHGRLQLWQRLFVVVIVCIGVLALVQALTPPWDYDGLMYHLQGPRLFLAAGRIEALPEIWQANGPFTIEMLFTLGMGLGNDVFAKLIHFTFGSLLILMIFSAGQRWLKPNGGWLAVAIMLGIPLVPFLASMAYADMAWASYSFLALYALLLWHEQKAAEVLIIAGICAGLALGSKYLALGSMAVLGGWLVFHSRRDGLLIFLKRAAIFGLIAALVGAPWYIKNWLFTGNPVYPMYWGGVGWSNEQVAQLMTYLRSFGTGYHWFDYLLSPINLYVQYEHFRTFAGSIEMPSLVFPLVVLYPLARRSPILDAVAGVTFLQYGVWLLGSEQTRFLLPLFPNLSLLVASVMIGLSMRVRSFRLGWILIAGIVACLITVSLAFQVIYFARTQPLGVVLGTESTAAFLKRNLPIYPALDYAQHKLPPTAHVLFLWDSQGYYCEPGCWPDTEPSRWLEWVQSLQTVPNIAARLRALRVTHLLIDKDNISFLRLHDPGGENWQAADFFFTEFQPLCAKELYHDQWAAVYEFVC